MSTFFATATGPKFVCNNYHVAATDEARSAIFSFHPSFYSSIKDELKIFLATNWKKWTVSEKPDWFTPHFLASIPEDMLPKDTSRTTREQRRKSIEEMKAGGGDKAASFVDGVRRFSMQMEQGGGGGGND